MNIVVFLRIVLFSDVTEEVKEKHPKISYADLYQVIICLHSVVMSNESNCFVLKLFAGNCRMGSMTFNFV
jgi:hypothetical protein